jgi:hypothetical protein
MFKITCVIIIVISILVSILSLIGIIYYNSKTDKLNSLTPLWRYGVSDYWWYWSKKL